MRIQATSVVGLNDSCCDGCYVFLFCVTLCACLRVCIEIGDSFHQSHVLNFLCIVFVSFIGKVRCVYVCFMCKRFLVMQVSLTMNEAHSAPLGKNLRSFRCTLTESVNEKENVT